MGFLGLGAWVLKLYAHKVDRLESHLEDLKGIKVTLNQMQADSSRRHQEQADALREMREGMRDVHDRIDNVLMHKAGR